MHKSNNGNYTIITNGEKQDDRGLFSRAKKAAENDKRSDSLIDVDIASFPRERTIMSAALNSGYRSGYGAENRVYSPPSP